MIYPPTLPCNRPCPRWQNERGRCPGIARRFKTPPMLIDNDRGDWYGCPACTCLAQYQDFLDNLKMEYDDRRKCFREIGT